MPPSFYRRGLERRRDLSKITRDPAIPQAKLNSRVHLRPSGALLSQSAQRLQQNSTSRRLVGNETQLWGLEAELQPRHRHLLVTALFWVHGQRLGTVEGAKELPASEPR